MIQDFSKGTRLLELNVLLNQAVMVYPGYSISVGINCFVSIVENGKLVYSLIFLKK